MVLYRRNRVLGGTYFFTVALRDRRARTLTDHIDVLRSVVMAAHAEHPFTMDAVVVLPEDLRAAGRAAPAGGRIRPQRALWVATGQPSVRHRGDSRSGADWFIAEPSLQKIPVLSASYRERRG